MRAQEAPSRSGLLGPVTWTNPVVRSTTVLRDAEDAWDGLLAPIWGTNPSGNNPRSGSLPSAGQQKDARQVAKSSPLAVNASPDDGLLGPFHWQNPESKQRIHTSMEDSLAGRIEMNELGQEVSLWGPLVWQNEQQTPAGRNTLPRLSTSPEASLAERPFLLMQGEELVEPDASAAGETIPIPSDLSPPPETVPLPGAAGSANAEGGSLAEADSLGEEPQDNRLQFLRADTVLLEPGEMQFDIGFSYQLFENDFSVVNNANQVVEARLRQRQLTVPFEIRYGLARRVQFFIGLPAGWAQTDFSVLGDDIRDSDGGIGDITTGLTCLLFDGQDRTSDTVFTFAASFPTGNDPLTIDLLGQADPALGTGFYSISTDILKINTYDPVVVFYGFGWRHQFESEYFGVRVQPGEEFRANLGVGFAVNQNITLSTRFNAAVITKTILDGVQVDGTVLEPMSMRFAATIANCGRLIEPFADIGVSDDAASTRFGIIWTY